MGIPLPPFTDPRRPIGTSEKALLVGFYQEGRHRSEEEDSLDELAHLAQTAGAVIAGRVLFQLREIHPATLIGRGKAVEIGERVDGLDLVLLDDDLTPAQNQNLQSLWGVKVLDRTALILDIFSRHARSEEGKIQVELAQMRYLLPRLVGRGLQYSQLAGGIGTRGPGETALEMDRRKVRAKIRFLSRELGKIRRFRELHRKKRDSVPMAMVSLVGYTNAGKSTLMNQLTGSSLPVADKLFVTLDPTVRRLKLLSGRQILLADTVGFVRKLPHQLIDAFQATFEEVRASDLLLHVVDASRADAAQQVQTVEAVLSELGLKRHPTLRLFNKIDQDSKGLPPPLEPREGDLSISARTGAGLDRLLEAIDRQLAASFHRVSLLIPHHRGSDLSVLYATSRVLKRRDLTQGVFLDVELEEKYFHKFKKFHTNGR